MIGSDGFLGLDGQGWLSIGIGTLVTVAVAVLVYYRQKNPKTLDYMITDQRVISRECVTFVVRIKNTGKRAIISADYERPIRFDLTSSGAPKIIAANVVSASPSEVLPLGPLAVDDIRPPLLNAGEWFTVELLTSGAVERLGMSYRIVDQSRAAKELREHLEIVWLVPVAVILFLGLVFPFPGLDYVDSVGLSATIAGSAGLCIWAALYASLHEHN